jgi:hypothetical protein
VADRIVFGGYCSQTDVAMWADARFLVVCDIDGGERSLLGVTAVVAGARCDFIIETHDHYDNGVSKALVRLFSPTHHVTSVLASTANVPEIVQRMGVTEQEAQVICDERRENPLQEWLVFDARDRGTSSSLAILSPPEKLTD